MPNKEKCDQLLKTRLHLMPQYNWNGDSFKSTSYTARWPHTLKVHAIKYTGCWHIFRYQYRIRIYKKNKHTWDKLLYWDVCNHWLRLRWYPLPIPVSEVGALMHWSPIAHVACMRFLILLRLLVGNRHAIRIDLHQGHAYEYVYIHANILSRSIYNSQIPQKINSNFIYPAGYMHIVFAFT